jgi:predicted NAD/FAD-binding protein
VRTAVIGSGISGTAAAWLLAGAGHDVHLLERRPRLGGHTHTVTVDAAGTGEDGRSSAHNRGVDPEQDAGRLAVDTGFIVYNEPTYPLLTALFDELDVTTQASDMSWSLRCEHHDLEYAGNPRGIAAQPRNLARPGYLRFLADIGRFNRIANGIADDPRQTRLTLGEFVRVARFGEDFARHYLLPMAAAIWSTGTGRVEDFPLRTLVDFFRNHGLLGVSTHHPWRTVAGGTSTYLSAMLSRLAPENVHLGTGAQAVTRDREGATVVDTDGDSHRFDAVVLACHADTALELLTDPSDDERELLGAWEYAPNDAWLHTDSRLLPRTEAARASWNYLVDDCRSGSARTSLTYDMNRLQSIPREGVGPGGTPTDWLVTLNPSTPPATDTVRWRGHWAHPTFTPASVASQDRLDELSGQRHTFYAGAYHRYGFHEDGLWSAVRAVRHLGVRWPAA